ncbi:uncharacterized protein K444DRAFT_89286 [Hyaloscypha bicolor E]|uniref:Uncharacterized protein n=1 Tax=Hyaloscypha bicolor E TaxID=1095630 RepID=A0A2J6SXH1_9HELO|nr:uncharacterized protein K444DRAFT_89286 [Hyaloscypha bicolor E]PMD55476.1 hypothetical protein K444DRAFT_89286 [Hyaloscypha bicolor E]
MASYPSRFVVCFCVATFCFALLLPCLMAFFILERREGNSCRDLIKVKSSCVAFVCLLLFQWMNGWMPAIVRLPRVILLPLQVYLFVHASRGEP